MMVRVVLALGVLLAPFVTADPHLALRGKVPTQEDLLDSAEVDSNGAEVQPTEASINQGNGTNAGVSAGEVTKELETVKEIEMEAGQIQPNSGAAQEAAMEAMVTSLVLGKSMAEFKATPLGGSVAQINRIIRKGMMPKILDAHAFDQSELNRLAKEIEKCGGAKQTGLKQAHAHFLKYRKSSKLHRKCRPDEAVKFTSKEDCKRDEKSKHMIKVLKCKAFATISQKWGTTKNNVGVVQKAGSESVESYLRRISLTFCGRHEHGENGQHALKGGMGGGSKDGALDLYLTAKKECTDTTRAWQKKVAECKRLVHAFNVKKARCNQFQDDMDSASCKNAVLVKDACETYAGCYFEKVKQFRRLTKKVRFNEMDRKAEWRGVNRIACLIEAFMDGKVTNKEVDDCKSKGHSTEKLTIKYPKLPPLGHCTIPTRFPSTGAYKREEFAPLPALAKGKPSQECSGVREVSLKPFDGSPKSCKCRRVVLNGQYSPGALVKCTNCNDVRRSNERNSCPQGSKIFAPASRQDWNTLLGSVQGLRSPHWIIDVTRPQNGCGGCAKHAMNSGNAAQKTWRTQDKAPWWLRSKKSTEPNGDYTANCFLNLHKFTKADDVSFNDGRCSYHSRSYYCQPEKMDLKPGKGSPGSCKCTKVVLSGRYKPGALVKCAQCLTVYGSTQKNSCPEGMKIFAPTSRADWKTFLNSAGPLRAPNWIIDVTRPKNGCGGCTRFPMKLTTPQQAEWKTTDDAPWWLRSTRYSEPNGDYTANCYMDLWKTPNSENNIQFNDNKCKSHARSYYCQPKFEKKKKVIEPEPAPPPGPKIVTPWNKLKTGLYMRAFYFKQGSKCPVLDGKRPGFIKRERTVNYKKTSGAWKGMTAKVNFAVQWTGIIYVKKSGKYTFFITSDDGSRLTLAGKTAVNNDGLHGMKTKKGTVALKKFQTRLSLIMFQGKGASGMIMKYKGPDTKGKTWLVPWSALRYQRGKGWKEQVYFISGAKKVPTFKKMTPAIIRTVPTINYRNTKGNWAGFPRRDNFGVKWTGLLTIGVPGSYRFEIASDDGSNFYIGKKRLIENDGLHGWRKEQGTKKLKRGKAYLRVEYFEKGGHAGMLLKYMGSDTKNRLIPVPSRVMEADV